jgi:hypothetical protein
MKVIRAISATTHLDTQGDQIAVGALVKNAEEANKAYYPLGLHHDPRIPPVGRIVRSFVVPRDDGHAALEFEAERFEPGDTFDPASTAKRLPSHLFQTNPEIIYDSNFDDPQSIKAITNLASALGLKTRRRTKKAATPLSVLIITATSWIAGGFLKSMGSDLYKYAKTSLMELMKLLGRREQVLVIQFVTLHEGRPIHVEIHSTNPSGADIDGLLKLNENQVKLRLKPLFSQPYIVRVVGELRGNMLIPKFGLRVDGIPVDCSGNLIVHEGELPEGFSISFQ